MVDTFEVPYQRLWMDFMVGDGTYTPAQLRKAKLFVCHEKAPRTYTLVWPGGVTEPPREAVSVAQSAERWHAWKHGKKERRT